MYTYSGGGGGVKRGPGGMKTKSPYTARCSSISLLSSVFVSMVTAVGIAETLQTGGIHRLAEIIHPLTHTHTRVGETIFAVYYCKTQVFRHRRWSALDDDDDECVLLYRTLRRVHECARTRTSVSDQGYLMLIDNSDFDRCTFWASKT